MMNIAKIISLLLATGHFWSNWAPCIGKTTFMGQHGAPRLIKLRQVLHSGT